MLETGQMAPDFTLPDQDGQPFTLSSLRGGYVVLYFYPKDNTSGCTKEACSLNSELDAFRGLGARVVGVSADGSESHQRFIARYSLGFTLLSDGDHEVMKAYGAYGEKTMYGKKTVGIIRSTFLIDPEGRIARIWRKVNTATHGQDVRAALEALGS